ncbi:hypothetical protein LJ737_08765 [Hymenobacter sp. 15J16-1T3B]|uniref:hypothetical protein n=1 Tax=Hymenobacter sp. 15J16-1T3B TaxID=2886941 RepID=UPI001D126F0C|nr:hypothetical protein [Hymenobacter sp. 15J16-1T3B]MCC3157329.1 hypothetical protein [Hymenobacter sp. 15J16-1T3B]
MKHFAHLFGQLASAALVALALTGCGRGDYAMLPKTSPYHETHTAARVAPAPQPVAVAEPAAEQPVAPAAVVAAPVAEPAAPAPAAKAATVAAKPVTKPSFAQQVLVKKMLHKAEKMAAKTQLKKHQNAASAEQVQAQSHLRLGIILLAIGLILALFSGINAIFGVLGTIAIIIGIVLLVLWLLEQV